MEFLSEGEEPRTDRDAAAERPRREGVVETRSRVAGSGQEIPGPNSQLPHLHDAGAFAADGIAGPQ